VPINEYECLRCGDKFELQWRPQEDKNKAKCPKCGSENLRRIIAPKYEESPRERYWIRG